MARLWIIVNAHLTKTSYPKRSMEITATEITTTTLEPTTSWRDGQMTFWNSALDSFKYSNIFFISLALYTEFTIVCRAGILRIELRATVLETIVLPLHYIPFGFYNMVTDAVLTNRFFPQHGNPVSALT